MNEQKISKDFLDKWKIAARLEGIPKEAYLPRIRIIKDYSRKFNYTFGVIMNKHRYKRTLQKNQSNEKCNLCDAIKYASLNPKMNLSPNDYSDFIIIPNKFPIIQGFSIAVSKKEKPIYTTENLENFIDDFSTIKEIGSKYGLKIFHNSVGFGATIPQHEHWHLTNFEEGYNILGTPYGFDATEKQKVKGKEGISVMPEFPFSHIIFTDNDSEKMLRFLKNIQEGLGHCYSKGVVPHTISEGDEGVLVTVGKKFQPKCKSSAEVAGHFIVKTQEDFLNVDFDYCMKEIDSILPKKEDLNLEGFI